VVSAITPASCASVTGVRVQIGTMPVASLIRDVFGAIEATVVIASRPAMCGKPHAS
jgi:hypothetical protein